MLKSQLIEIGIKPVTLELNSYDLKNPLRKALSVIEACKGLIAVGLERCHAYFLRDNKIGELTHRKYTSSWLHMEAAIAFTLGLPVWVMYQKDICEDGIFDRKSNTFTAIKLEKLEADSKKLQEVLKNVKDWVDEQKQTNEKRPLM